jgi:hypothetical protein
MCEGVCDRCREKVQWKFRYDKYKPLKAPATCQQCKQKVVTKAYRTICDKCASTRKVCPGCCEDMLTESSFLVNEISSTAEETKVSLKTRRKARDNDADDEETEDCEEDSDLDEDDEKESIDEECDEDHDQLPSTPNHNSLPSMEQNPLSNAEISFSSSSVPESPQLFNQPQEWDETKFAQFAQFKYSKNRVVGSKEDALNSGAFLSKK